MKARELMNKLAAMPPEAPVRVGRDEVVGVAEIEQDGEKVAYLYREATNHYPSLKRR